MDVHGFSMISDLVQDVANKVDPPWPCFQAARAWALPMRSGEETTRIFANPREMHEQN